MTAITMGIANRSTVKLVNLHDRILSAVGYIGAGYRGRRAAVMVERHIRTIWGGKRGSRWDLSSGLADDTLKDCYSTPLSDGHSKTPSPP